MSQLFMDIDGTIYFMGIFSIVFIIITLLIMLAGGK